MGALIIASLISSAVVAAVISGIFALINSRYTLSNSEKIEGLKSHFDKDIENLKAQLGHGQVVSTTQWNAEFNAYQQLWKSMVRVRSMTTYFGKLDDELTNMGYHPPTAEAVTLQTKDELTEFRTILADCMTAINDHAPFYPDDIRTAANTALNMAAAFRREFKGVKQQTVTDDNWFRSRREDANKIMKVIDSVEAMIRRRLESVRLIN